MKATRTYVFVFLPIPSEWSAHASRVRRFKFGSNGSSSLDGEQNENSRFRGSDRPLPDTCALPNHLFWTWFVDNPRSRPRGRS